MVYLTRPIQIAMWGAFAVFFLIGVILAVYAQNKDYTEVRKKNYQIAAAVFFLVGINILTIVLLVPSTKGRLSIIQKALNGQYNFGAGSGYSGGPISASAFSPAVPVALPQQYSGV
jgi:hypothetical protein